MIDHAPAPPASPPRRWWVRGLIALLLVAITGSAIYLSARARCFTWTGSVTCRVETSAPMVALSFDDGPTPEGVDATLAALEREGVHATFFLIGRHMQQSPGQARRLVNGGHELGNHSYSHVRMTARSAAFYDQEIAKTDRLLRAEGVTKPTLFRPPFGKKLFGLPTAVDRAGYRMVTWDVEDDAEAYASPRAYAASVVERARPGSIILMHPMYRHNQVARDALPLILSGLKAKGFRIVTVGELLAASRT